MLRSSSVTRVYYCVEVILATATAAASVIAIGVSGDSYTRVKSAKTFVSNVTLIKLDIIPALGEPAIFISIASLCVSVPLCIILAASSLCQMKQPHVTDTIGHMAINYISVFVGVFIVGGLGAGGMLSAISASAWGDCGDIFLSSSELVPQEYKLAVYLVCYRAARYLVGTSVSSFIAFIMTTCLLVYESIVRFWKSATPYQICETEIS